jgi:3-hydroxyacyl-[acyl-carrier-protein] dehydratase
MRFCLIDRIVDLQPGTSITTTKSLSMADEYLVDHFPRFPVMPGVMMLEAMTQSGAWLVRITEDFAHSLVLLKEARNVRYREFVQPGQVLTVTARIVRHTPRETHLDAAGSVDGKPAVSARLVLERFNLAETRPEQASTDAYIRKKLRGELADFGLPPTGSCAAAAGGALEEATQPATG